MMRDKRNIRDLTRILAMSAHAASCLSLTGKQQAMERIGGQFRDVLAELVRMGLANPDSKVCHGSDLIAIELGRTLIAERGKGTLTAKRITEMVDEAKGRMDGNLDRGGPVSVPPPEGVGRTDGVRLHLERQGVPEGVNPLASMA